MGLQTKLNYKVQIFKAETVNLNLAGLLKERLKESKK